MRRTFSTTCSSNSTSAVGQPARDGHWCVFAGFGSHQCRCRLTTVDCCRVRLVKRGSIVSPASLCGSLCTPTRVRLSHSFRSVYRSQTPASPGPWSMSTALRFAQFRWRPFSVSPVAVQDRFHLLSVCRLPLCFVVILVSLAHTFSTGVQVGAYFESGHYCYRAVRFSRECSLSTRSYCRPLAGTARRASAWSHVHRLCRGTRSLHC